jgi:hypothetical protein
MFCPFQTPFKKKAALLFEEVEQQRLWAPAGGLGASRFVGGMV